MAVQISGMKSSLLSLLSGGIMLFLAWSAWGAAKVEVVVSRTMGAYVTTMEGFKQAASFDYEILNMEGNVQKGIQLIKNFTPENTSLVVLVGTEAAMLAKNCNSAIPIEYTIVLDPLVLPTHAASGILIKVELNDQFTRFNKYFPTRKRIGVIYNPVNSGQDITQARNIVVKYGLTLLPIAVDKSEDIDLALGKFNQDSVDMIWMVPDAILSNPKAVEKIIIYAADQKLLLVGLSLYHVKAGATIAFAADINDLGQQTAELAQGILQGTIKKKVEYPRKILVYVNTNSQKQLGFDLSRFPEVKFVP